jgi:low affinity Fe/Cu permease
MKNDIMDTKKLLAPLAAIQNSTATDIAGVNAKINEILAAAKKIVK